MTYRELWQPLVAGYGEGEAKAIARYLLEVKYGLSMADILCGATERIPPEEIDGDLQRLLRMEPVQYVAGKTEFCGRWFHVEPGVLIPRPETAELCQWIIQDTAGPGSQAPDRELQILDIGTGSGCIAVTLAADIPRAAVTAWDISEKALAVARGNAKRAGVNVSFERQDALRLSPTAHRPQAPRWDIIVSNPPYIWEAMERNGMERQVLDHEPREALFAPDDAPDLFYRCIGDYACETLKPGGRLYLEINPLLADGINGFLRQRGFGQRENRLDQFGKQRFICACKR